MIEDQIKQRLAFLNPTFFNLENESASEQFNGKSRMERHRMIYKALGDLFKNKIHALSIKATTEKEEQAL